MVFLLGTNLKESQKFFIALHECYGLSSTSALRVIASLGVNKNCAYEELPLFLHELLDLNVEKLIELKFRMKLGSILKHYEANALSYIFALKNLRALRHKQCLPVRGQRTHTNAKTQKSKLKNRIKILKKA